MCSHSILLNSLLLTIQTKYTILKNKPKLITFYNDSWRGTCNTSIKLLSRDTVIHFFDPKHFSEVYLFIYLFILMGLIFKAFLIQLIKDNGREAYVTLCIVNNLLTLYKHEVHSTLLKRSSYWHEANSTEGTVI